MALKFDIKSTQDCGTLKYTNCSTYCDADNYVYKMLIAGIGSYSALRNPSGGDKINVQFNPSVYSTQGLITMPLQWTLNSGTPLTTANQPTVLELITGVNTIELVAEDVDGNTSTLIFKVKTSGQTIEWVAIPELSITTNQTLAVQFGNASYLLNTAIDAATLDLDVDSQNFATLPQNYTLSSAGTFNPYLSFEEDTDGEAVSLVTYLQAVEDTTDCTAQLTTDNISSVAVLATSPSGNSYTADITDNFLEGPFNLTTTMFGIASDTFESGIWTFQTIVTKVTNTGTFIFAQTIKVVLFCKEQCSFNAYVATYAEEELDCCTSCKEEKEKKIILMSTYIDAIKNASACGELTKITKFINLLQRLLSNKNCSC